MTYRPPLEVLDEAIEKGAADVGAGKWVTMSGAHIFIPTDQYHPIHGWVKVSHGDVPEGIGGRRPTAGVYHATTADGKEVSFREGESTHHAMGNDVYDSESGKKVGSRDASGKLPIPPPVSRTRATVPAGARPRAPLGQAGSIQVQNRATGSGAPESRVFQAPSGSQRYSGKPIEATLPSQEEVGKAVKALGKILKDTHEHFAGEYPGKGKRGSQADLHEHLRANGFHYDHSDGESYKVGSSLVYKHPDGREAQMVLTTPADQTWETSAPSYNPETRMTSTRSSMRRPADEYELR